jgi:hypothetical protein
LLARLALVPRDLTAVTKLCDDRAKRALEVHERARAAARAPFSTHRARRVEAHAALVLHFWETFFLKKVSLSASLGSFGTFAKKKTKDEAHSNPKKNWPPQKMARKNPKAQKPPTVRKKTKKGRTKKKEAPVDPYRFFGMYSSSPVLNEKKGTKTA